MIFSACTVVSFLSVTTTLSALSLHPLSSHHHARPAVPSALRVGDVGSGSNMFLPQAIVARSSSTALRLVPMGDEDREKSQFDKLRSKRDELRKRVAADIKPKDDEPKADDMTEEELAAFLTGMGGEKMFEDGFMPSFNVSRETASGGDESEGSETVEKAAFIDFTEGNDENGFHIPNRIGFTTKDWGDAKAGFVAKKLKKKERKAGLYNKADLKKAFLKLQNNGISFVETSEAYGFNTGNSAESLVKEFVKEYEPADRPVVASTFPNPWRHALSSRSLPRYGAKAIVNAAEESLGRIGASTMGLYQIQNSRFYIGGTTAIAKGLSEIVEEDHAHHVGVKDMGATQLVKLQRKIEEAEGSISTNQFEFSLTNRKSLKVIEVCKRLGITPICYNVLDGGLATGKYTVTNPTGGKISESEGKVGPFSSRKLQKLDTLFKTLEIVREKVGKRIKDDISKLDNRPNINTDVTTTQIAINYVKSKGAVPLVSVTNLNQAKELLGCVGWDLKEDEVAELDKVCVNCGV